MLVNGGPPWPAGLSRANDDVSLSWRSLFVVALLCAIVTTVSSPASSYAPAICASSKACAAIALASLNGHCRQLKVALLIFLSGGQPCAAEYLDAAGVHGVRHAIGECPSPKDGGPTGALAGLLGPSEGIRTLLAEQPVLGALAGTSFGWFMTALGAAAVILVKHPVFDAYLQQTLDLMLGVAAGVMIAASYWSLLAPALSYAEEDGYGAMSFVPVALGFLTGGAMLRLSDSLLKRHGSSLQGLDLYKAAISAPPPSTSPGEPHLSLVGLAGGAARHSSHVLAAPQHSKHITDTLRADGIVKGDGLPPAPTAEQQRQAQTRVRRMLQLVIAITAHNAPEGLAVGVAFGALGRTAADGKTGGGVVASGLGGAVSLALGIGIQNFPEGLAVSLPLMREGVPFRTAFTWGQLSGAVEPFAGLLGAAFVSHCRPLLPFTMALAAGAMIYVVADALVPEMHANGNGALATQGLMVGFVVMMTLDVALG